MTVADPGAPQRLDPLSESPPVFPSPALDRLTRAHPVTPALVFLPAVAVLSFAAARRMTVVDMLALAAAGYLFWTLCEYWDTASSSISSPRGAWAPVCTG